MYWYIKTGVLPEKYCKNIAPENYILHLVYNVVLNPRAIALKFGGKNGHYQSKVFVCVSVIREHMQIISMGFYLNPRIEYLK